MERVTRVVPPAGNARPPSFSEFADAEKAGLVIPSATGNGGQVGRVPPAVRKITATYEAVDLETASARRAARLRGEMPPIAGGLDGPGISKDAVDQNPADEPDHAPGPAAPGMVVPPKSPDGADPAAMAAMFRTFMSELTRQAAAAPATHQPPTLDPFNPPPLVDAGGALRASVSNAGQLQPAPAVAYLAKRGRVGFTVLGGTYSVPVVDVIPCAAGLVILLPVDAQSATFVPSLGAEVTVEYGGKRWDCFFPGVAAILEPLGVQVLSFVYQDDKQASHGKA